MAESDISPVTTKNQRVARIPHHDKNRGSHCIFRRWQFPVNKGQGQERRAEVFYLQTVFTLMATCTQLLQEKRGTNIKVMAIEIPLCLLLQPVTRPYWFVMRWGPRLSCLLGNQGWGQGEGTLRTEDADLDQSGAAGCSRVIAPGHVSTRCIIYPQARLHARSPPHLSCGEGSPVQAASNQRVSAYQWAGSALCSSAQSQQLKLGAGELRRPRQASSQDVRPSTEQRRAAAAGREAGTGDRGPGSGLLPPGCVRFSGEKWPLSVGVTLELVHTLSEEVTFPPRVVTVLLDLARSGSPVSLLHSPGYTLGPTGEHEEKPGGVASDALWFVSCCFRLGYSSSSQ
ncbi:unnamed protein product [Pleuronectes platessa]|uniref:Uncharacterized protein n=1 Tax=Pleuronectes platessa TaxID=8262 RepID=A0A9N7ZFT8_PLEPL|nr:unnamed protein product [Pleuronectes platessa]